MATKNPDRSDYFKTKATEQNNQLRIALISIAVGACAFFAKEINNTSSMTQYPFLYRGVFSSFSASVVGLLAWKCSAHLFYVKGEGKKGRLWHVLKVICDITLPILLAFGLYSSFMHLIHERRPITQVAQPTSPPEVNGDRPQF